MIERYEHLVNDLYKKRMEIMNDLQDMQTKLLLEMGSVDKDTLTKLRALMGDYANAEKSLNAIVTELKTTATTELVTYVKQLEKKNAEFKKEFQDYIKTWIAEDYTNATIANAVSEYVEENDGAFATKAELTELKSDLSEVHVYSKNILNLNKCEYGIFTNLGNDSGIVTTGYLITPYYHLSSGESVAINNFRKFIAKATENAETALNYVDANTDNYVYTATTDCVFRVCFAVENSNSIQIEYNTECTSYVPYSHKINEDLDFSDKQKKYIDTRHYGELYEISVYSFGDSLMYGHYEEVGILDYLAEKYNWNYSKLATNGAKVVGATENTILYQITNAPTEKPKYIILDGMMNDTYDETTVGEITEGYNDDWALSTYCGSLERIFWKLRGKYTDTTIIFVCCHKTPSRSLSAQEVIQEKTRSICEKWSIPYVDVYREGGINCCIDVLRNMYSYNEEGETSGGNGTHLTANGYRNFYAPMIEEEMVKHYSISN